MPSRVLVAEELANLFGVLSHPQRVRIIEELREGERDVNTLQETLGTTHSRVSQQLALLRAQRLVVERREGRRHFYRLAQPELASWILDGLRFFEAEVRSADRLRAAVDEVQGLWGRRAPARRKGRP